MICLPRAVFGALGVVLVLGVACSSHRPLPGHPGKPVYRSSRKIPEWVTRRPEIPGHFVSVGIATGMSSLEEGQRAAAGAAVSEIVTYLGIQAEVLFTETRTELTTRVTDQITTRGAARVASGQTVEMYYEAHWKLDDGRPTKSFDVYVLVAIPYAEIEEERRRIQKELKTRRALAERLLQDGLEARKEGNFEGALLRWTHLLEILQGDDEARTVTREAEIEIARLVDDLEIVAETPDTSKLPRRVLVYARLRQGDRLLPLAGLPLRFFFSRGRGVVAEGMRTDEDGVASIEIRSVSPRSGPVVLAAGVDLNRLFRTNGPLPGSAGDAFSSSLARLVEKRAEAVLVQVGDFHPPHTGPPPPWGTYIPPGGEGAGEGEPVPFPSSVLAVPPSGGDPVRMSLLAGHDRIYAPRGQPEKCVAYLLEIVGSGSAIPPRRPLNLALVLDQSGSMEEEGKLEYLKQAAKLMVANLAPYDVFSLITYATDVEIVSSAGTVSNSQLMDHVVDMIRSSGTTNLSGGLIEGIHQAEIYHRKGVLSRVVLVSDGLANEGITDPSLLAQYAGRAADLGISVTTVGLGKDFDEELLMVLANEGHGNYYYVSNPAEIPAILSDEMSGLAKVLAQNVTIELHLEPGMKFLNSLGVPFRVSKRKITFRVGQVAVGERIRIAFQLEVPPGEPGPKHFGTVLVAFDSAPDLGGQTRRHFPLKGTYTESFREADESANEHVNRFVHVLAIMDSMLLAKKSGSQRAIQEVLQYLERELPRLRSWVEQSDDREMKELANMFQHCVMILREELRKPSSKNPLNGRDLAKEISYKLYRLRHHPVWEAESR